MGVKHIYESFSDEVFEKLKSVKGDRSWRDAIVEEFGVEEGEKEE